MKVLISIYLLLFSSLAVHGEQITVNYKATIDTSNHPTILLNEVVEGTITYETETPLASPDWYYDTSPGSMITATFANGLVVNTDPNAINRVDMYMHSTGNGPEPFDYTTNFHSNEVITNSASTASSLAIMLSAFVNYDPQGAIRTSWDDDLSTFHLKYMEVNVDGHFILATITEFSTGPQSPVTVEATTYADPISAYGGRLYFVRDVENTSDARVEIKRWAYIVWPDGTHYNRDRPTKVVLDPMERDIQTSAYYTIPSYWPAGEYTYYLNSIVVDDVNGSVGAVTTDSFTFTKSE